MSGLAARLEHLYRENAGRLLRYFRSRHTRAEQAEDLLQQTFVHAAAGAERLAAAASPQAWLFTIARRVAATAARRSRPTGPLDADPPARPEAILPLDEVRAALAALPAIHREPLELRLRDELSYAEIADVMGVPVGTVRSRLHNALRAVAARLSEESPEEPA